MKHHIWRGAAVAIAAALSLALVGCSGTPTTPNGTPGSSASAAPHTVNVGIVNLSLFYPLYVANAKGYFADEGLTLNLQSVASGQDAVPLASTGKLDVVVAGFSAGMFNAMQAGLDVKVVGSMAVATGDPSASGTHLVANPAITSLADLKGKRVGAAGGPGGTGAYITALILQQAGMTLSDVQIVNLSNPDMPTALKNGGLDAALLSAPYSFNAMGDGAISLGVSPKGYSGTGVLYGGQFANSQYAQKFFNALARGAKDLQGSSATDDANMAILAKALNQDLTKLKAIPLDSWLPNLAPLPDQLQKMQEVWIASGAISYATPLAAADIINSTFSAAVPA